METVTEQQVAKTDADRKVVETTQELITLFKREFGDKWQDVFQATVSVDLASS
jgi:hypothetical protein